MSTAGRVLRTRKASPWGLVKGEALRVLRTCDSPFAINSYESMWLCLGLCVRRLGRPGRRAAPPDFGRRISVALPGSRAWDASGKPAGREASVPCLPVDQEFSPNPGVSSVIRADYQQFAGGEFDLPAKIGIAVGWLVGQPTQRVIPPLFMPDFRDAVQADLVIAAGQRSDRQGEFSTHRIYLDRCRIRGCLNLKFRLGNRAIDHNGTGLIQLDQHLSVAIGPTRVGDHHFQFGGRIPAVTPTRKPFSTSNSRELEGTICSSMVDQRFVSRSKSPAGRSMRTYSTATVSGPICGGMRSRSRGRNSSGSAHSYSRQG